MSEDRSLTAKLRASEFRPTTSDFRLLISDFRPPTSGLSADAGNQRLTLVRSRISPRRFEDIHRWYREQVSQWVSVARSRTSGLEFKLQLITPQRVVVSEQRATRQKIKKIRIRVNRR